MRSFLNLLILFFSLVVNGQVVFEHTSNTGIYEFLDELASQKTLALNSAVKPYSRSFISSCLDTALVHTAELSTRQQKELRFYRSAFRLETGQYPTGKNNLLKKNKSAQIPLNLVALIYHDSLFRFQMQPILGGRLYLNDNGNLMHRWWGASMHAYIGNHLGMYASLRDNWETEMLAQPGYFTRHEGANYKVAQDGRKGGDYSEMRGGISWAWKWGYLALIKDHFSWGSGYNGSNILSGRTPSFAHIRLNIKPASWVELNYIHGWLVSEVIDSSRSYLTPQGKYRAVYRNKYLASNFITITPWKYLNFSFGNSIIYSDNTIQPAYLIPLMFYKSIDHTLSHGIENQNSQMFFDLSIRNIKHVHLYGSVFIDDWKTSRITSATEHNLVSWKGGLRLSNWPLPGLSLTTEYTRSNPVVYKHKIPDLTYASNRYNLGHYLGDNSEELYILLSYKPIRGLELSLSWMDAIHGNEYAYNSGNEATSYPVLKDITWHNRSLDMNARYQLFENAYVFGEILFSNITSADVDLNSSQYYLDLYTPAFFQGKQITLSGGFAFGF
jgi:hypothetical protein